LAAEELSLTEDQIARLEEPYVPTPGLGGSTSKPAPNRLYNSSVKQIWTGRMAQAAGKYSEHAPMATVCCNACRTCVTTNVLALLMGAGATVGVFFARAVRIFSART
jgi:hypothetical protein